MVFTEGSYAATSYGARWLVRKREGKIALFAGLMAGKAGSVQRLMIKTRITCLLRGAIAGFATRFRFQRIPSRSLVSTAEPPGARNTSGENFRSICGGD